MKNKIMDRIGITTLAAMLSIVGYVSLKEIFSEKIGNKEDLLRIAEEETTNLKEGRDKRIVYFMNGKTPRGTACSGKLGANSYLVVFDRKRNRTTMRHELYHIFAGHTDNAYLRGSWKGRAKFQDEVTANLYSYFGLKL